MALTDMSHSFGWFTTTNDDSDKGFDEYELLLRLVDSNKC